MEEVKLWAIEGSQVEDLKPAGQTETEKLLEDALVNSPDMLLEDLTLVGRQTPAGGGQLDLLGVDGDGRLAVFELKRGTLTREAVAQVIDYASYLDGMDLEDLANHVSQRSGSHGIDKIEDFKNWYADEGSGELESLKPIRMFLVGLGVDDRTERMVKFLSENSGMDISLLTFYGFDIDGKTILAKRVEVDGSESPSPKPKKPSLNREERLEKLLERAERYRVPELFDSVRVTFRQNWSESIENTLGQRLGIRLPERGRPTGYSYARLSFQRDKVVIRFSERAINLCREEFSRIIDGNTVPFETVPRNREPLGGINPRIEFLLTSEDWEAHKGALTNLIQSIYQAWQDGE